MAMTSSELDRCSHWRENPAQLHQYVASHGSCDIVVSEGRVHFKSQQLLQSAEGDPLEKCFLGVWRDRAIFLRRADSVSEKDYSVRTLRAMLSTEEQALAAYASGVAHWHDTHRFCGRCGGKNDHLALGHQLKCSACGQLQFPRMDPAVIMTVTDGDWILLGRSPGWPAGVYSTLAGFVEIGESLEQAVAREVKEETGVVVDNIRPVASQPWPFPSSIMLGYQATATRGELSIDHNELEDARWFHKDELASFGDWSEEGDGLKLPRLDSIARILIQRWVEDGL